ncbi:MAG TPA: hypothetical protein VJS44_05760 [Pyrinomonadaceae bacterium]|nr:hypothetical protein [Pyrinomonadaceae bacterium]
MDRIDRIRKRALASSLSCTSCLSLLIFFAVVCGWGASKGLAQTGLYAESPEEVASWVTERVRRARSGRRERVRLPLVRRSDGWGCICPYYYIGLSTNTAVGNFWIEPRFQRQAQRPSKNMIVVAEGYFTGRRLTRDLRTNDSQPEEWIYKLWEFRVSRVRLLPEGHDFYNEDSPQNRVTVLGNYSTKRRN